MLVLLFLLNRIEIRSEIIPKLLRIKPKPELKFDYKSGSQKSKNQGFGFDFGS